MKQRCKVKRIAALLALALLLARFGPTEHAHAATIDVTTFADNLIDNGDCSLREAVQAANTDTAVDACPAGSGADTIQLFAGTYTLSIAGAPEEQNQNGDLDILGDLTIKGVDTSTTNIINTVALDRVIQIPAGANATLTGLSISNGHSSQDGGAISNSGILMLNGVTVKNSIADGNGGGIFNDGIATLNDGTINNNQSHYGGGIYNSGIVTLNTCIVNNDETTAGGDGGGIYNKATLIINSCWIHDNMANGNAGGGIYNQGTANVTNSFIHNGYAAQNGGNIYSGDSGGVSSLTISNTTISQGLVGANGGGVYNDGALGLTNVTITRNNAARGSGIYITNGSSTRYANANGSR